MTKRTDTSRMLEALRGPSTVAVPTEGTPPVRVTGSRASQVRFTFDMARNQHRFVKRFVLDCDTTGSAAPEPCGHSWKKTVDSLNVFVGISPTSEHGGNSKDHDLRRYGSTAIR